MSIANTNDQGETAVLVGLRKYASPAIIRLLVEGLFNENATSDGKQILLQEDKYGRSALTVALERRAAGKIIQILTSHSEKSLILQQDKLERNGRMKTETD